eukprot:gene15535-21626_t
MRVMRGLIASVLVILTSRSLASKTNGGTTTYHTADCYEAPVRKREDSSFVVSDPSDRGSKSDPSASRQMRLPPNQPKKITTMSTTHPPSVTIFTLHCKSPTLIAINDLDYCRWTRMDVTLNGNFLPHNFDNQGMQDHVPGVQILKLYGLTLTYADLAAAPATINITLHPERDGAWMGNRRDEMRQVAKAVMGMHDEHGWENEGVDIERGSTEAMADSEEYQTDGLFQSDGSVSPAHPL